MAMGDGGGRRWGGAGPAGVAAGAGSRCIYFRYALYLLRFGKIINLDFLQDEDV